MKVLFLGPPTSRILKFLLSEEKNVHAVSDRLDLSEVSSMGFEFVVSHGYQHVVRREVLLHFSDRIINLHISLLPWNRGADPNLWSFLEQTPKGVTLHYMDEGLDTGDIIAQKEVFFEANETLASSYERLQSELLELFKKQWPRIRTGTCERKRQQGTGTFHRAKDKNLIWARLPQGWATPVKQLETFLERKKAG